MSDKTTAYLTVRFDVDMPKMLKEFDEGQGVPESVVRSYLQNPATLTEL